MKRGPGRPPKKIHGNSFKNRPENPDTYGEILKQKRIDKRLTQREVAEKIGVSREAVAMVEIGKAYPRSLQDYVDVLGLSNSLVAELTRRQTAERAARKRSRLHKIFGLRELPEQAA